MPKIDEAARSERRRRFLDAAHELLAEQGWRDLTVDDIAAAAGASKGAFYTYFASKTELLVALLEEGSEQLDAAALVMREGGGVGLQRFVREVLRLAEDASYGQLRADLWAALPSDERLRESFAAAITRRRQLLRESIEALQGEGVLDADLRANALASILLALGDGLTLHAAADPHGFRWPYVRAALERLVEGVQTSSR